MNKVSIKGDAMLYVVLDTKEVIDDDNADRLLDEAGTKVFEALPGEFDDPYAVLPEQSDDREITVTVPLEIEGSQEYEKASGWEPEDWGDTYWCMPYTASELKTYLEEGGVKVKKLFFEEPENMAMVW
jgi:hypothetical protein